MLAVFYCKPHCLNDTSSLKKLKFPGHAVSMYSHYGLYRLSILDSFSFPFCREVALLRSSQNKLYVLLLDMVFDGQGIAT
jgi:hypothetical protein